MLRGSMSLHRMRPGAAAAELRQLLPLLPLREAPSRPSVYSVASLIVFTAHSTTATQSPMNHTRDCPVLSKRLPLSRIGREQSFAAAPCESCVRERVHYVSSVSFCEDFERQCTADGRLPAGTAAAPCVMDPATLPVPVRDALVRSYGSLTKFQEEVVLHATGALSPGCVWVVFSPPTSAGQEGRVSLMSLPGSTVPLVHGVWPLALINVTEERVCTEVATVAEAAGGLETADDIPPWSHAARTAAALGGLTTESAAVQQGCATAAVAARLSSVQSALAAASLCAVDWHFVERQLAAAEAYYASAERAAAQQRRRREKEQVAAVRAMSHLRDSGAVIHASDSVTIASAAPPTGSPTAASGSTSTTPLDAAESFSQAPPSTESVTAADGAKASPADTGAPEGQASPAPEATEAAQPSVTTTAEPRAVQHADGTWEYHYHNGNVTKVRPDGTKVFQTQDLTTTVFVNGDTLFEYPNGTSILDRADGVRVTTYADGTKKEERLR